MVVTNPTAINFTGTGLTITQTGTVANVDIQSSNVSGLKRYSFQMNLNGQTTVTTANTTFTNVPAGWTVAVAASGVDIAITHNTGLRPSSMVPQGWNGSRFRSNPVTTSSIRMEYDASTGITIFGPGTTNTGASTTGYIIFDIYFAA